MSRDALRAAKNVLDESLPRTSVSRAYYAAYAGITAKLVEHGVRFARGWNNPQHELLPRVINTSRAFEHDERKTLNRAIRRLRLRREDADYRPQNLVDDAVAREAVRDAATVLYVLEIVEERNG